MAYRLSRITAWNYQLDIFLLQHACHLVPMRRMGTQFRMRRIQFDSCASQVNNCLRRRPEGFPCGAWKPEASAKSGGVWNVYGGRTAPSFSCGAWEGVGMRCIQFNPRALRFVCLCITNERRSATQTGRGSHAAHGNQGKRPPLRKIHACLTDKRTNNQITKHDL